MYKRQLPGIAAQNLMGKGIGFGPEGDYKISALSAVLMKMSEGKEGATGFIEDYTYDLTPGQELELASHMLEVPPAFAATKPETVSYTHLSTALIYASFVFLIKECQNEA